MFGDNINMFNDSISERCSQLQSQYNQLQKTLERCNSLSSKLVSDYNKINMSNLNKAMSSYKNIGTSTASLNTAPLSKIISLMSGMFGNARANGGNVSQSVPYLVGERGPELFVPSSSGKVVSNGASVGGKPINIVMNVSASDAGSFSKSKNQIVSELARAIRGAKYI